MRTLAALLALDECWWHGCRLPGAWAPGEVEGAEAQPILVCGLHAQVVAYLLEERPDLQVELWMNDGIPSLHMQRAA